MRKVLELIAFKSLNGILPDAELKAQLKELVAYTETSITKIGQPIQLGLRCYLLVLYLLLLIFSFCFVGQKTIEQQVKTYQRLQFLPGLSSMEKLVKNLCLLKLKL